MKEIAKVSNGLRKLELKTFRKEIEGHHKKVEILRGEIGKIQSKCPHDEGWEVTTYYWAPAHGTPGKACNVCGKFVSSINPHVETIITTINQEGPENENFEVFDSSTL